MKKTTSIIAMAALWLKFRNPYQIRTFLLLVITLLSLPEYNLFAQTSGQLITGTITDSYGKPLPGATIRITNTNTSTLTDKEGHFTIKTTTQSGTLTITFISFNTRKIPFNPSIKYPLKIILETNESTLNEVQVIGYGQTTRRLNTGSISAITAVQIEKQPVANILSALSGRMPGVFVQTTNGLPGGNINVQIRGKGSIAAGTNPLYIIDGVPMDANAAGLSASIGASNIAGVTSPLNSLNPADIENITVLKDADATAIYGSRATNGVVLITTKKGKAGKTQVELNVSKGINQVANYPRLLNLEQYLQIRREAFANDGQIPSNDPDSPNYAPDLTVWSQTESTDWAKHFLGNTGQMTNMQLSISGGDESTNFNFGGNYRTEGTILPGNSNYKRGGLRGTFQHTSKDKKFYFQFANSLNLDDNQLYNPSLSFAAGLLLPPNYPVYESPGVFNWYAGTNPTSEISARSKTRTDNTISNVLMRYTVSSGLAFRISAGYNKNNLNQIQLYPASSLYPGTDNYSIFGTNSNRSIIFEPQVDYLKAFKNSSISLLMGGTYQNKVTEGQMLNGSAFSNEGLMENISSAGTITGRTNTYTQYKYVSVFGRVNYVWKDRYVVNATIRRDGSSRFAEGNQFGNFGSLGAAWLFADEPWIKNRLSFLSYGKLRSSYGLTGNDQITDYQYLSAYGNAISPYQGVNGLMPSRISNANFHWETTRKLEFAVELGFLNNRILLNVNHYRNSSDDQLVNYAIPRMTGFASYQANLPAVIRNTGWEVELNTKNIEGRKFSWSSSFNITMPKTLLKSFEGFETSSYAQILQLGYDISRVYGTNLTVDPATGKAVYGTAPGSADVFDYFTIGKQTPDFYGGLGNTFQYGNWSLDLFFQFAKQMGRGGLSSIGQPANNYAVILNRWQNAGNITDIPRASNTYDSKFQYSQANYFNTSYLRLKNVGLSYSFPKALLDHINLQQLRIYAQGQNLWTYWDKNAAILDPESGAFNNVQNNIPPIKSFVIGLQLTL
ncbi:TonB-linked SusC/RagA family outer membrane protein [Pedobacter cryoconitis]|uniref:TonB-linked SusC/RagA family outer membrane protein n=1 Tax=Pedobacter cryoconitis TaxID=188932 RepID=A0A7W8ZNF1_9SPHI|nr:SusC/RagA family TonB-linked outer membrane protein [Pedobacter cryoconitis]MBB5637263.1 TonB-linked SusC/RagA family outer membrane protein [Pedobacter cryoconitis]